MTYNSTSTLNPKQNVQITQPNNRDEPKSLPIKAQTQPTIALVPWCSLFEDHFDTLGVSFETFAKEFTGSYQFGYIDALQLAGVRTVIFYISARVSKTLRFTHEPTGALVCVLPAPKIHLAVRRLSHLPGIKTLALYLSIPMRALAHELRQENCKAILCQEYENARFDVCVLLGKLMHLPVFATFQGGHKLRSSLEYPLRWLTMRMCGGLVIATQTQRQRVHSFYGVPLTKLARIFNPIDVASFSPIDRSEARAALNIPMDARVVVWHGRVEIERKGLDILLEAWAQICRERPEKELRLLLIGTGSNAEELRQSIEAMKLPGVIRVDRFVHERAEMRRYLSAADVYTLPSRHEGFPVAPIEAMACGLPVVAADAPGMPDILEEGEASGGLVVPRGDATALASALGRVLDNEAWGRELGKRAQYRAEQYFSLEVIGKQLRELFLSEKTPIREV